MAVDGVKIIDSDWAHDIYSTFMDRYDAGIPVQDIQKEIEKLGETSVDDFEYEIYFTTYCLALWETGHLDKIKFDKLVAVINKQACADYYKAEFDEQTSKARLKETGKLVSKLSKQNIRVRKRKKNKLITKFHYQPGDVLAFKGSDNLYHFTYLLFTTQHRGECVYQFIPIIHKSENLPQLAEILDSKIAGRKIFTTLIPEGVLYGMDSMGIFYQDMAKFKESFILIGNFQVAEKFRKLGARGVSRNWNDFVEWHENIEPNIKAFRMSPLEIRDIILAE